MTTIVTTENIPTHTRVVYHDNDNTVEVEEYFNGEVLVAERIYTTGLLTSQSVFLENGLTEQTEYEDGSMTERCMHDEYNFFQGEKTVWKDGMMILREFYVDSLLHGLHHEWSVLSGRVIRESLHENGRVVYSNHYTYSSDEDEESFRCF